MGPATIRVGLTSTYFGSTYGGGEKYLGTTAEAVRDGFPPCEVELVAPVAVDVKGYEERLGLDLRGISFKSSNRRVTPLHRAAARVGALRPLRDRVIGRQAAAASARYDLHVAQAYRTPVHTGGRRAAILCQFPYRSREGVDEFQLVVVQSDYVRKWVERYWARDAVVVPPPIDIANSEPDWGAKENLILAVGRFFAGGHEKRHDLLVEQFKLLCAEGLAGWRLVLAGSVHRGGPHRGYFDRIKELAAGAPIEVLGDVPRELLEDLYARAAICWHAAGYGVPEDGDPEQREHFGMAPAEAMARGAVPVVYDGGGLPEVVRDGEGRRWLTPEQLRAQTLELAANAELRRKLGEAARVGVRRFSKSEFKRRLVDALRPLVEDLRG